MDDEYEDEEPILTTNLHMNEQTQMGRYNLKIVPTYNSDKSANFYNVIVKMAYRLPDYLNRIERNG